MWKSFRVRILMAVLGAALASIGLLFGANYRSAVRTLEHNYLRTSAEAANAQAARFDESMSGLYQDAVRAGADTVLRDAVTAYLALGAPDTDDILTLSALLKESCTRSNTTFYLYLPARQEMLTSDELHPRCANLPSFPWARNGAGFTPMRFSDNLSGTPRWMYGYSKPLTDAAGAPLAVFCAGMPEQTLRYALSDESGSETYLLSGAYAVAITAQPAQIPIPPEALRDADTILGASGGWLYAAARAPFSGIRLLRLTERDSLRIELAGIREQFFLLLVMIVILAIIVSEILANWLYRPVGSLIEAMGKVGGGDFSPCPEPGQPVEFRQLSRSFNQMIAEINGLIDDLVRERTAKAEAELRALQYQIKPHFMYNTLNSIKYAAILQGNEKIGEQLGAFIELLEASISKKGAFLRLSEEVQLLERYVSLQRYRYLDCFTVEYDLSDAARGCYVPRLLLQPIVENAVLHGMDVKRNDNHIRVAALVTDGSLWITVQDNGKGMSSAQLRALLCATADDHRQFTGIGIANIRERLHLSYGQDADFQVFSQPGAGTKFVLMLPASYDEEEYAR